MPNLSPDEKRALFVADVIVLWKANTAQFYDKAWGTVAKTMEFVGNYDWSGADKKAEALKILAEILQQTDSPGPDFLVDSFIQGAAEFGIDYLYDAFKGKFAFDGTEQTSD